MCRFFPGDELADGRFKIVRNIGKGGMGEVYQATDTTTQEHVALKFLLQGEETDETQREYLIKECEVTKNIESIYVCRSRGPAQDNSRLFMVMDYINGENCESLLKRVERLTEEKVVKIGIEICKGLNAIHDKNLIHRDLKPANIILAPNGTAKIVDLGVAVLPPVLPDGTIVGTPSYMAPEQLTGNDPSPSFDIFALGLVLYELATNERVLHTEDNASPQELLQRYDRAHRPPSDIVPTLRPDFDAIVMECLRKDPAERPRSVEEVLRRLEKLQEPLWLPMIGEKIPEKEITLNELLDDQGKGEIWLAQNIREEECLVKLYLKDRDVTSFQYERGRFTEFWSSDEDNNSILNVSDLNDKYPYYFILDIGPGRTLRRWAQEGERLASRPLSDRLSVFYEILKSIAALHRAKLRHADIRPDTIYIFGEEENYKAAMRDTGLGAAYRSYRTDDRSSNIYRAPELGDGESPKITADVYSLGVLLYQLSVGDISRSFFDLKDVENEILRDDIASALQADPKIRLKSVDVMIDRLKKLNKRTHELEEYRSIQLQNQEAARITVITKRRNVHLTIISISLTFFLVAVLIANHAINSQKRTTERVADFLEEILRLPDPVQGYGQELTAEKLLLQADKLAARRFEDEPRIHVRILNTIATGLQGLGDNKTAKALFELALAKSDPSEATRIRGHMADSLRQLGELDEAQNMINETLAEARGFRGAEAVDMADYLLTKANIQRDLGRSEENEEIFGQVLALIDNEFDFRRFDHATAAVTAYNNYGEFLLTDGRLKEAEDNLKEAERILQQLPIEHSKSAEVLANLGDVARENAEYEVAKDRYLEALEKAKDLLGDKHSKIADISLGLGMVYEETGNFKEAEKYLISSVDISRGKETSPQKLGENLMGLALFYSERGRYEEAIKAYKEAFDIFLTTFGKSDPYTLAAQEELAWTLKYAGQSSRSEDLYIDVLRSYDEIEEMDEQDRAYQAKAKLELAELYRMIRRDSEAQELEDEVIEWQQAMPISESRGVIQEKLGDIKRFVGQRTGILSEASRWYLQALETYENEEVMYRYGIGVVQRKLASVAVEQGNLTEAEDHLQKSKQAFDEIFVEGHWRFAMVKAVEGAYLSRRGEQAQADDLLDEALKEIRTKKGENTREAKDIEALWDRYHSSS